MVKNPGNGRLNNLNDPLLNVLRMKWPLYTTQASNQLSPLSSYWAIRLTEHSLSLSAVSVYKIT